MDIRKLKFEFIKHISEKNNDDEIVTGLSLVIDCLIDNEIKEKKKPIVVCGFKDHIRQAVLQLAAEFCGKMYCKPPSSPVFTASILHIFGDDEREAMLNYIECLRSEGPSLFYWADNIEWFYRLPSGLFHVVDLNCVPISKGFHAQNQQSLVIAGNTYEMENIAYEMFDFYSPSTIDATETPISRMFHQEALSGLIRPIPAPRGMSYDDIITVKSPAWQKHACVAIRRYQSKECKDGMSWDTSDAGWENVKVHPLTEFLTLVDKTEVRQCLIGQVTMVQDANDVSSLSTVWVHPFYRRKGLLSGIWHSLRNVYGDFHVEEPNDDMKAFMRSVDNH